MNKFKEIFLDLEQKILSNEYPPHSLLPSENQSPFHQNYMVLLIGQLLLKLGNWYVKERLMVKLSF